MKISNFILCRSCVNTNEEGCSVNRLFITVPVLSFPSKISFAVVITFVDLSPSEKLVIRLVDSDGKTISESKGEIGMSSSPSMIPSAYFGLNVSIQFKDIQIDRPGEYCIQVQKEDGNPPIGEKRFFVYQNTEAKEE